MIEVIVKGQVKTYKEQYPIKINNYVKYVTVKKILSDELKVAKFMCFGGGKTNLQVEFLRNTFCVTPAKLQ